MTRQERDRRYRDAHRDELKAYRDAHKDERQAYRNAHKDELRDTREVARLLRAPQGGYCRHIKANEPERRLLQMKAENDEDIRLARWDAHVQDILRAMPPTTVSAARHPDCDLDAGKFIDATLFS